METVMPIMGGAPKARPTTLSDQIRKMFNINERGSAYARALLLLAERVEQLESKNQELEKRPSNPS